MGVTRTRLPEQHPRLSNLLSTVRGGGQRLTAPLPLASPDLKSSVQSTFGLLKIMPKDSVNIKDLDGSNWELHCLSCEGFYPSPFSWVPYLCTVRSQHTCLAGEHGQEVAPASSQHVRVLGGDAGRAADQPSEAGGGAPFLGQNQLPELTELWLQVQPLLWESKTKHSSTSRNFSSLCSPRALDPHVQRNWDAGKSDSTQPEGDGRLQWLGAPGPGQLAQPH